MSEHQLPAVIEQIKLRLGQRRAKPLAGELWTATWVLMGMRYSQELVRQLLQGITAMEESVTYQEIIKIGEAKGLAKGREEGRVAGRVEGVRETLVRLGTKHFGSPPDAQALTTIRAIDNVEQLEQLVERVLDVSTWQELLSPARPRRSRGRRPPSP